MSTLTLRLEAYDPEARQLVAAAQTLADERRHPEVEPLHLLYLLLDRSRVVQQAIERLKRMSSGKIVNCGEKKLFRYMTLPSSVVRKSVQRKRKPTGPERR